jgi:hypothetical protein
MKVQLVIDLRSPGSDPIEQSPEAPRYAGFCDPCGHIGELWVKVWNFR